MSKFVLKVNLNAELRTDKKGLSDKTGESFVWTCGKNEQVFNVMGGCLKNTRNKDSNRY